MGKRSMNSLSYGLCKPHDLLEKMKHDGLRIGDKPHPYDVFNFIITSASLNEWIPKYYENEIDPKLKATIKECKDTNGFPNETLAWINDVSCIPNTHFDIRIQILECILICRHTSNASKHYNWAREDKSNITAIEKQPEIKDYYQYFFTKTGPGLYVEYNDTYYCITQVRDILIQFYEGLLLLHEKKKLENSENQ